LKKFAFQNRKIFSTFFKFRAPQFFKKEKKIFQFLDFCEAKRRKAEYFIVLLFMSLAVLDPDPPIRGRQGGTP